ncbi:MAG TPA: RsmE family RNA methyltransferase [Acidimicrobiales bacterium]|nr:RsmE family RNA methyltransferase [Acidimicrobiales bacterium]
MPPSPADHPGPAGPPGGVVERAAAAAQVLVDDPAAPVLAVPDAHHLSRVLRLRPGEVVVATDGRGRWCRCRYRGGRGRGDDVGPDRLLEPDGPVRFEPAPAPSITVAFAPVKADRPEWVVQKLTELGVDRIVPLVTARSVVRWDGDRADRAADRLRRVAAGALGQCRRVWLPDVTDPCGLAVLASDPVLGPGGLALAQLGGDRPTAATTAVAIGPEGGWAPDELAAATATVGLGPLVLRAETAAVAAGAILAGLRTGTVGVEATP